MTGAPKRTDLRSEPSNLAVSGAQIFLFLNSDAKVQIGVLAEDLFALQRLLLQWLTEGPCLHRTHI